MQLRIPKFENPRWRTAAILKIEKLRRPSLTSKNRDIPETKRLADFDEICIAMDSSRFNPISDQKFGNMKIQYCGLQPS